MCVPGKLFGPPEIHLKSTVLTANTQLESGKSGCVQSCGLAYAWNLFRRINIPRRAAAAQPRRCFAAPRLPPLGTAALRRDPLEPGGGAMRNRSAVLGLTGMSLLPASLPLRRSAPPAPPPARLDLPMPGRRVVVSARESARWRALEECGRGRRGMVSRGGCEGCAARNCCCAACLWPTSCPRTKRARSAPQTRTAAPSHKTRCQRREVSVAERWQA